MAQSPSLKKLSGEFVVWLTQYRGFSQSTADSYDLTLDQFRHFLATRDGGVDGNELTLLRFTDEAAQAFVMDMAGRGIHPNTIISKLSALSSFARYLMQRKDPRNKPYLDSNPVKMFAWPTLEEPDTEFLYSDELRAFLDVELVAREAAVRELLFDTGARVSEVCRANVGDMVPTGDDWSLAVIVKGRGTRRRKVFMPLSPQSATLIRGALADRGLPTENPDEDAAQPLLVNSRGHRFARQEVYHLIRRIGEAAGITRFFVGPHTLRHTISVVRAHGGVDDYERSRLSGQKDPRSQARYRHINTALLRLAKEKQAAGLASYLGMSGAD